MMNFDMFHKQLRSVIESVATTYADDFKLTSITGDICRFVCRFVDNLRRWWKGGGGEGREGVRRRQGIAIQASPSHMCVNEHMLPKMQHEMQCKQGVNEMN